MRARTQAKQHRHCAHARTRQRISRAHGRTPGSTGNNIQEGWLTRKVRVHCPGRGASAAAAPARGGLSRLLQSASAAARCGLQPALGGLADAEGPRQQPQATRQPDAGRHAACSSSSRACRREGSPRHSVAVAGSLRDVRGFSPASGTRHCVSRGHAPLRVARA